MIGWFKQWDSYWNNFNNWDEALLSDSNRPRDEFGLRINPWRQMDKWDFASTTKNFYLDQITAIWGKEITWQSGSLVPEIIPLGSWTSWYDKLPFSDYWIDLNEVKKTKKGSYTKWNLNWRYSDRGWIIIPATWSYFIKYYSELWLNTTWQPTFIVALSNWVYTQSGLQMYDYSAKQKTINPDNAWFITIQDLEAWEELYLAWMHASNNSDKGLYLWTVIIFKLS